MASIPKTCFTFWQGNQFSKLHYYTIYSLVKYNPGVDIIIYTSSSSQDILVDWTSDEHTISITNIIPFSSLNDFNNRIRIINIDFQKEYNISNDISVVFKADFIRIAKLFEHGGIWFDFDILFIRPIPSVIFNITDTELFYFSYSISIPTGFIGCRPNIAIMDILFKRAKQLITEPGGYQKIGPTLWTSVFTEYNHLLKHTIRLETDMIYPYKSPEVEEMLKITGGIDKIKEWTFGIHWYNGNKSIKKFINKSINSVMYPHNCILNRYLHKVKTDTFL